MATIEDIRQRLLAGEQPADLVKAGFPKSSVYRVAKQVGAVQLPVESEEVAELRKRKQIMELEQEIQELEAEKAGGEASLANMVPYITSKMNVFTANDLVRPIISQQKPSFNFREAMDTGKILIINLAKGRLGDANSYLLGMIIVGKILIAAMSRVDIPEEKRRDFYLYIDEFHNVTTKTISSVLAEARKYKLAMTIAHQFIGQIDEETRKAIFGNVGSMSCFRVGPEDAKYLLTEFTPVFDENDMVNVDNANALIRLLINGATSNPFNIHTFPPSKSNTEVANLIKELSRVKYGRDLATVENDLLQRMNKAYF